MRVTNARFWVYWNGGWVKLTLRPRQTLRAFEFHHTDEGWSSESEEWFFDGSTVWREWSSCGCDCDGRLDRYGEDQCPLHLLHDCESVDSFENGIKYPSWERVTAGQYDQNAELAGY